MLKAYQVTLQGPEGQTFEHKCVSPKPEYAAMGARRQIYDKHKVKAEVTQVEYLGTARDIFPGYSY